MVSKGQEVLKIYEVCKYDTGNNLKELLIRLWPSGARCEQPMVTKQEIRVNKWSTLIPFLPSKLMPGPPIGCTQPRS